MNKWKKASAACWIAAAMMIPGIVEAAGMEAKPVSRMSDSMNMDMVQLKKYADQHGFVLKWDGMDRSVTITCPSLMRDDSTADKMMDEGMMDESTMDDGTMDDESMMTDRSCVIKIMIGSKSITVNGMKKKLDMAPFIKDQRTYVSQFFVEMYLKEENMMK